jgi:hypothetical protein
MTERITARHGGLGADSLNCRGLRARPAKWARQFHVDFTRGAITVAAPAQLRLRRRFKSPRELTITVVSGKAEQSTCVFTLPRSAPALRQCATP